ncbi:glycosyltransferase [Microbacterium sp. 3J1]|uniref:glycosyltransferase n=1 Tax=Microbacterium sp. 3J1 TaxID=861269 RepID=UPI000B247BCA|nr:glycosyltransferase [Microbacterium sp. 3J1]
MGSGDRSDAPRRPRVLIGGYACGPVAEPEARAGWELARAATRDHDVWVITRHRFRQPIEDALAADPVLARRLHVTYLDLPPAVMRLKRRSWDLYWYYAAWQRSLGRTARRLHAELRFDVAHHVSFANDWMPCGLVALSDVPLVWGPVGGASTPPALRLSRWLGLRGTLTELIRGSFTSVVRRFVGDRVARRASLVVAQNQQGADHFARRAAAVVVEPNATLDDLPPRADEITPRKAVFAGRLIALKGAAMAIDAIARTDDWTLDLYGGGYEEKRLRARVHRLGLDDRVRFLGHQPRERVLDAIAHAEVFLFPSMRDQAGWVVAEASTIGCPVVCLPLGGPPALAGTNGHVASLDGDIVGNLVEKMREAADAGGHPTDRWSIARLPDLVSGWYRDVMRDATVGGATTGETRRLRILASYRRPKSTTNPYITQLFRSLNEVADVTPYSPASALFGRYDVVHLHWPELLVGGHNWRGRTVRRAVTSLLLLRWRITRVPLVRTVHNLERPTNINAFDHGVLERIDRMTTLDIRLNDQTPPREGIPGTTIEHGHYRDWFAPFMGGSAVPGRIGYVGLIRRYKGVEDLVSAFTRVNDPGASLHIAGKPSTADLVDTLRDTAAGDARVTIDPRYLDDEELVHAMTAAELIVLPYRHMHNSGTALAALSVDRPVLVPDNEVNRALSEEVGPGWVLLFDGELTPDSLREAIVPAADRAPRPDLSAREWSVSRDKHLAAFRRAVSISRGSADPVVVDDSATNTTTGRPAV